MNANPKNDTTSLEYRRLADAFSASGPSVDAAGNATSDVLEYLLARAQSLSTRDRLDLVVNYVRDETHPDGNEWDTPLLRAIACHQTANIEILLRHGANPNGIDMESQAQYARRFRRVKFVDTYTWYPIQPIRREEVGDARSQLWPLTLDELSTRKSSVSRFWTDTQALPLDASPNGNLLHSLVMAARTTPHIFDMIVHAGADASSWSGRDGPRTIPEEDLLTPSASCVSTPLHSAISADSMTMLSAILDRGFDPNSRALIAGAQALTPMQHAIVLSKVEAYRILACAPLADTSLLTPTYQVHLLHFVVAQMRHDLLDLVGIPLSAAPATALGHTLLHTACLPLNDAHIALYAPKVRESVHDVRTLDLKWVPASTDRYSGATERVSRATWPGTDGPVDVAAQRTNDMHRPFMPPVCENIPLSSTDQHGDQMRIVQSIIADLGVAEFERRDIYGNVPLHYLASARTTNDDVIIWMRQSDLGDRVWKTSRNSWGWTPADLWLDNVAAVEPERTRGNENDIVDYSDEEIEQI